jgi:hypothetical protein
MGHALARPLGVTPWEALLGEVRRSAGEVAWLDYKVGTAASDDDLAPGGSHHYWDQRRLVARQHMARVSKLALDAGVAEALVAQVQRDVEPLRLVLERVIGRLGLNEDESDRVRGMIRTELLALDASDTIEGEVTE